VAVPAVGGREKARVGRAAAAPPQSSENAAEGETGDAEGEAGDGDACRARAAKGAAAIGCAETLAAKPSDSAPKTAPI
jgi:hypothetical protein